MDRKGSPGWLAQTCESDLGMNPPPPVCFCRAACYWVSLPVLRALLQESYVPPWPQQCNQTSHARVCLITVLITGLAAARVRLVLQYSLNCRIFANRVINGISKALLLQWKPGDVMSQGEPPTPQGLVTEQALFVCTPQMV